MSYLAYMHLRQGHIQKSLQGIIISCIQNTYRRTASPQEPDFVATLTIEGAPKLQALLENELLGTGISCSATGVFCHQSPKVEFAHAGRTQRCELGDLLLVHFHSKSGKIQNRNALLLQAKMASGTKEHRVHLSEQHQLSLYSQWPEFEYYSSGPKLTGQKRSVFPHQAHSGAQYLLIDRDNLFNPRHTPNPLPGHYPCAVWMPEPILYPIYDASKAIFDFLTYSSGRIFGERNAGTNGWTQVVWDLLESGLEKTFNRANIGISAGSRMAGAQPLEQLRTYFSHASRDASRSVINDILGFAAALTSGGDRLPPDGGVANSPEVENEGYASMLIIETRED